MFHTFHAGKPAQNPFGGSISNPKIFLAQSLQKRSVHVYTITLTPTPHFKFPIFYPFHAGKPARDPLGGSISNPKIFLVQSLQKLGVYTITLTLTPHFKFPIFYPFHAGKPARDPLGGSISNPKIFLVQSLQKLSVYTITLTPHFKSAVFYPFHAGKPARDPIWWIGL